MGKRELIHTEELLTLTIKVRENIDADPRRKEAKLMEDVKESAKQNGLKPRHRMNVLSIDGKTSFWLCSMTARHNRNFLYCSRQ